MKKTEKREIFPDSNFENKEKHVFLVIKDGILVECDEFEANKDNHFYRVNGAFWDTAYTIIDYDKTKIRPFVKDILNRQDMFIEVKMIKTLTIICGAGLILCVLFFFVLPWKSFFENQNSEIIKKLDAIKSQKDSQPLIPLAPSTLPNYDN